LKSQQFAVEKKSESVGRGGKCNNYQIVVCSVKNFIKAWQGARISINLITLICTNCWQLTLDHHQKINIKTAPPSNENIFF